MQGPTRGKTILVLGNVGRENQDSMEIICSPKSLFQIYLPLLCEQIIKDKYISVCILGVSMCYQAMISFGNIQVVTIILDDVLLIFLYFLLILLVPLHIQLLGYTDTQIKFTKKGCLLNKILPKRGKLYVICHPFEIIY